MNLALPWSNSLPQKFYCCCSNLLLPQDLCTCYAFCLEVSPSDYLPVLFRWFSGKESTCQCKRFRRLEFDPGSGRSPGGGNGNPFQYSCLGNPIDRGAWQATVHGVTKQLDMTEQLYNNNNRENSLGGGIHSVRPLVAYQCSTSSQLLLALFKNYIDK